MNKIPMPLRLLISLVVAGALGVGSFLVVGAVVTSSTPAAEAHQPVIVPVYAPTSHGEAEDEIPGAEAFDSAAPSAEVGSIEVATGDPEAAASDPDLDALLDAIADGGSSPTEELGEELVSGEELGVYIVGEEPLADPCAPRDGSVAADCPPGSSSTVLALMRPDLAVRGYPYPSATEVPGEPRCLWQNPGDDEAAFGVLTNAPADITVTYWPTADPTATAALTLRTTPTATRRWNERLETETTLASWWAELPHCGKLTGLTFGGEYAYDVVARDDTGRTATQPTGYFTAVEPRTEPLPVVFGASASSFIAAVPHRATEVVQIRAWRVDPAVRTNNCSTGPDLGEELRAARDPQTWTVDDEDLARDGYDPEFTRETMAGFPAPEGSYIFVCMRWFAADAPSPVDDRHLREASVFLQSPDQLVPTFTLAWMEHADRIGINATHYTIGTLDGEWCETWTGPTAAERGSPDSGLTAERSVLCDVSGLPGRNWTAEPAVLLVGRVDGEGATDEVALDLGVESCRGVCELPAATRYRIGTETGEGRPTSFMTLDVTWSQGHQNGLSWWASREIVYRDGPADAVLPQFDTDAELRVIDEGGAAGIQFDLRSDRPAAFSARISGDCFGAGTVQEVMGDAAGDGASQTVTFGDLCRGSVYTVGVQLTDAVGTSVFSPYVPTTEWSPTRASTNWPGGRIEIDPATLDLAVSVVVQPTPLDRVMRVEASLLIGYRNVDLGLPEDGCISAPFATGPMLLDDVDLRESVRVLLTFRDSGTGGLVAGLPECDTGGSRGALLVVSERIALADLLAGTVRIGGGPDATYPYEIVISRRS